MSPIERWFENLEKIRKRMKKLNHETEDGLKPFSKQTLALASNDQIKGQLAVFCQNSGVGLVPDEVFDDVTKDFVFFLETVGVIPIETSLNFRIFDIAVKHKPELINESIADVMKMSIDEVFGPDLLNANQGKKELDLILNQRIPDDFYPPDGSFLSDGSVKLADLIQKIIS
jgi:hypothetical protein